MLNNEETIQRLLNTISGLERNIIFQQCITNVASRVGEELRWQLDTLKQHKEERIILKGAIIRDGETPESLQKFVQETINDIERKSENTGKIKMVNSHRTGRIRGGIHQDVVVTLKTKDMKHTLYKNRKHLQHRMKISPCLPKQRETTLEHCKNIQDKYDHLNVIDYVFEDMDGNLKVRLKDKHKGSYYHIFNSEENCKNIIESTSFESRENQYAGDPRYSYERYFIDECCSSCNC